MRVATYLLTWNPAVWDGEIASPMLWSCGHTKRIVPGDRLFLMRQVTEPRGVCGSGWATSGVVEKDGRLYVEVQVEVFRDPATQPILTRDALEALNGGAERPMKWGIQSSGTEIPPPVAARLESAWQTLCGGPPLYPDEVPAGGTFVEGATRVVVINAYERDPEARRQCLAIHGTACCVCGFSFRAVYGPDADGYIHVHHLHPLSQAGGPHAVDPATDLRPVCPNCHAVLHLGGGCRTINEVRQLLRSQRHPVPSVAVDGPAKPGLPLN
ncbi:MAG: HNH endonuclease [Fimbriiglobus sp.]